MKNTAVLHYKAFFEIRKSNKTIHTLLEEVQLFLYEFFKPEQFEISFVDFCNEIKSGAQDRIVRVRVDSTQLATGKKAFLWALKICSKDPTVQKREWRIHIGIQVCEPDSLILKYAEFFSDYTHHTFTEPSPPQKDTPPFVGYVLNADSFQCVITDDYLLPQQAVELDMDMLNYFKELLFNGQRRLPVFVDSCPQVMDPYELFEATMGNAVVFFTENPFVIDELNRILPERLRFDFGSVQTFHPVIKGYTQVRTIQAWHVQHYGAAAMLRSFRRAYCEGIENDELARFVTYDEISLRRFEEEFYTTVVERDKSSAQRDSLAEKNAALAKENQRLSERNEELEKIAGSEPYTMASEYEHEWTNALREKQALNEQVADIALSLFSDRTPLLDGAPLTAEMAQLIKAISHRIYPTKTNGKK